MNAESGAKKADGLRESNVVHILNKTDLAHSETAYEFQGHHYGDTSVSFIMIDAPPSIYPEAVLRARLAGPEPRVSDGLFEPGLGVKLDENALATFCVE